jgi:hypothetical protein
MRGEFLQSLEPLTEAGIATINLVIPAGALRLTVRVFDPDGPFTMTILDEKNPSPGNRAVIWDGMDNQKKPVANWSQ